MKKLLALLFCLVFAAGAADARTLYVDATRPNNNGNGLKPATAKKTIQTAINIAQAGDTILVYPGSYAPIKTNNKKIAIKSVKGAAKTKIVRPNSGLEGTNFAFLGAGRDVTGKNTLLVGFLLDGRDINWLPTMGVGGGQLKSCVLQRIGGTGPLVQNSTLTGCILRNNKHMPISNGIFNRCKIIGNESCDFEGGHLSNCLVADNKGWGSLFYGTILVNCTLFKNCIWYSSEKPVFAKQTKFYNCILRNNYHRLKKYSSSGNVSYGNIVIHNADTAKTYANTYYRTFTDNRDPKFADAANGVFTLKKGSGCIDKGKLTDTLKKYVGATDMAGKKRVRGSAIDLGCYEY